MPARQGIAKDGAGTKASTEDGERSISERHPDTRCGLCGAKLVATSLTIGTGGSVGDFGPSLVLGGLFGGAFGRAAAVLLHDPSIDPDAFALVGMGTFYGGLAHVPISSLIMVSEMAGSYDLLVPLMPAEGIAFVALRRRSLYHAQVPTHADSPVHRPTASLEVLSSLHARDVMTAPPDTRRSNRARRSPRCHAH